MKKKIFWTFIVNSKKEYFADKISKEIESVLNETNGISKIIKYWKFDNAYKITLSQDIEFEKDDFIADYMLKKASLFSNHWNIHILQNTEFSMICNEKISINGLIWINIEVR